MQENYDYVIALCCFCGFATLQLHPYIHFGDVTMLLKGS